MSPLHFKFPPESFSVVYTCDGTVANANVLVNCNGRDAHETSGSSPSDAGPNPSLFSCFHFAFRNGIKVLRKDKRKKDKHKT